MIKVTVPVYRSREGSTEETITIKDGDAFDIRGVTGGGSVLIVLDPNAEEIAAFMDWRYALWEETPEPEPVDQPELLMGKLLPDAA